MGRHAAIKYVPDSAVVKMPRAVPEYVPSMVISEVKNPTKRTMAVIRPLDGTPSAWARGARGWDGIEIQDLHAAGGKRER